MRSNGYISQLFVNGGPFIGKDRPNGVVTVEKDFFLNTADVRGKYFPGGEDHVDRRNPVRWFQAKANNQEETTIPGVQSISIDRNLSSDAASCEITILNNEEKQNTGDRSSAAIANDSHGDPGRLTFNRGDTQNARDRWSFVRNEWHRVLMPGAMLRCLDTETEMLTKRGWLKWDQVEVGDVTLGINPETGTGEWQDVRDVFRKHHTGQMIHLKTRVHDSITTMNHRWLVEKSNGGWDWKTTETLSTGSRIPLRVPAPETPKIATIDDAMVELAAWYFTEGSADHRQRSMTNGGNVVQSHVVNPENVARIRSSLQTLFGDPGPLPKGPYVPQEKVDAVLRLRDEGRTIRSIAQEVGVNAYSVVRWCNGTRNTVKHFKWNETVQSNGMTRFSFTSEVAMEIRQHVEGPDKIPTVEFLTALTADQLNLFIDVCILADGSTYVSGNSKPVRVFIQKHIDRVKAFEFACVLAGRPTNTRSKGDGCFSTTLLGVEVVKPVSALSQRGQAPDVIDYEDIVWCPSVRHGNFVARRNGTIYVTGNTYEGYGGHEKDLDDALVDGNLMQTGTWIVDDITQSATGELKLKCRDTASLLIDQLMYPELMPDACYPTMFYKNSETDMNYKDISSIVVLIALWAGFWCKDSKKQPKIFGNVEKTGFVPDSPIGADFFDKRTCMDVINELKALVGYVAYVDQEGAFHFHSPNYWEKGNFYYNGKHTDNTIQLDEKTNLMSYTVNTSKASDRSDIYISSSNPQLNIPGTKFVHHKKKPAAIGSATGTYLRGMSQPMLVGVKVDMPLNQMNIMAQLIQLYLWFARRSGNATIPGNPCIDINDQVHIWERTSSESFYHYVRGVRSSNDLTTGKYTMDLETTWLGSATDWAIVADGNWNIKYSDETTYVSPDAYGPYREGFVIARKAN